MGVEIKTESESDHQETLKKHKNSKIALMFHENTTEKQLLQIIAKDTKRILGHVVFFFWITMIGLISSLLMLVTA